MQVEDIHKLIIYKFEMSYQNESFGMMDPGYFVPRGEILNWINDLLKVLFIKCSSILQR